GKYIFPVQYGRQLTYDHSEREIDVDLSFEKEIFAPGEEVFAKIKTAPHAQILISVVDEAAIRAGYGEHKPNFRSRFYHSSYIWKRVHQFSSHRQHEMGGNGAEGGGGDDGDSLSFRDNFIDNPVFETVRADENGNASVIFTLPDRITSWRVTAIALTQNGSCGDASENIFSSIDFYVDLLHTNEYIVGDDIAAVARAYGADSVDFNFSVSQNEKIIFTNEIKNSAGREIFNAGKLPVGDYTMRVYATAGNNRDGVEFPFSVTASALIISNNISGDISDFNPNDLKKRPLPVQITFTNAKIRPLMRLMSRDADSNSFRTDQIAAAAFVNYFFTGENDAENVKNKIHAGNGGIPELVYSDTTSFDEFAYAARFAASFPEYVDREKIIRYVNENFDYRGIYEAHRLALAAVGEPVLLQLREAAENFDTNNLSGNNLLAALYLAAAFAAIGDDVGARDFMARIEIPENIPDERQRETAHTLLFFINTSLNPELAWEYVRRENENKFISDVPERINFVRRAKLLGENISEFEFFLDGEKQIVRLENFQRKHLHLSSEQFLALNPRPISGETNFNLHYFGYDSSNWNPNRNTIKISRTITPDDDLYLVELTVTLPPVPCCGSFVIYDRLPSNMRYVPLRRKTDVGAPFFSVQNRQRQLMEINFFVSHNHARTVTLANHTVTLTYHAMKLFDAEMSDGVSYVKNRFADNPIWGSTNSTQ
ncbi:MAG: hypothetical protein FWD19_04680, partial [Defluviitaleaceae bacterium]|nr:hypothetical protein [Defluviitaleaceae bacterium]